MKYEKITSYDNLTNNIIKNEILWFNDIKNQDDFELIINNSFPFEFNYTDQFIKRINQAKINNETICIIGDYDCDGVCATSILKIFLDSLKIKNHPLIGDRAIDGYGMNNNLIDQAYQLGANLIITVDNGIKCRDEVIYANELGIDVIVTDHHLPEEGYIPNCLIYNPHYKNNIKFKDICGAFVINVLIFSYLKSNEALIKSSKELMYELYELSALATIGDMMPLYDINRILYKHLEKNINNDNIYNLGIKKLISKLKVEKPLKNDDLSFKVIPVINAPGRMKNANILIDLFLSPTDDIIDECIKLNELRKNESRMILNKLTIEDTSINILFDEAIPVGILGILASQIKEKTNKPTLVFTKAQDNTIKGSGRSANGLHMLNTLSSIFNKYDLSNHYGGHEKAVGLTLHDFDSFKTFKKLLANIPYTHVEDVTKYIECNYYLKDIYEAIEELKPYGQDFKLPIYHFKGRPLNLRYARDKHSQFDISMNNINYKCIYFNNLLENDFYDFYFYVNKEIYNSNTYYKCFIIDAIKAL